MSGIDVSEYQGQIDWRAVRRAGIRFVWIKAGEGVSGRDPWFEHNRRGATLAGLTVGAYWFGHPAESPELQAAAFAHVARKTFRAGCLPPVLDLEVDEGRPAWELANWRARFYRVLDRACGHKAGWYSGDAYTRGLASARPELDRRRLRWIAAYPGPPSSRWDVHQYSAEGQIAGIHGRVDLNRLNQRSLSGLTIPRRAATFRLIWRLFARHWSASVEPRPAH